MKRILAFATLILLLISFTACSGGYEKAPEAVFSSKTEVKDFTEFSIEYPSEWNAVKDKEIASVDFGQDFFELNSEFDENNLCSSLQIIKAQQTSKKRLKSIVKTDDIPQIISQFQQTYGTDIKLKSSTLYKIDKKECLNYELTFEKNDVSYVVSQTYFIQNNCVYILNITIVNGIDSENALNIPLGLKFNNN